MAGPRHSSFAPAFWLLAAAEREALTALHLFCRAADEAVDACDGGPEEARGRLDGWRREVNALYGEGVPATVEGRALLPHVARYSLGRADFERLLGALALDVNGAGFATESDLARYCEGVAASPGYLALCIFGCPESRAYAHHLGLALQITNFLRDACDDLRRGRLYFPLEDLARSGISFEELRAVAAGARAADPAVGRLIAVERERARAWFEEAERAYRKESPAARRRLTTARAMERLYRRLLDALVRDEPLPRHRVRPSRLAGLGAVAGAWLEGVAFSG
jgi:phytoene synthase